MSLAVLPVRADRPGGLSALAAAGSTLSAVSMVRLVGVVLLVPASLAAGRSSTMVALALTTLVVALHLLVWPPLGGRWWAVAGMLAVDLGVGVGVLALEGTTPVLTQHLLGAALVAAALLGFAGVGLAAGVGAMFGMVLAASPQGAALPATTVAALPVPFVAVSFLAAVMRRVLLDQECSLGAARRRTRIEAADRERSRLARELHDSATKTVVGITLSATSLRHLVTSGQAPERAERAALDILDAAETAAGELRVLVAGLRSPCTGGVVPARALGALVTSWGERTGVSTLVRIPDDLVLDPGAQAVALAIVGECLANTRRYAGAGLVEVRCHRTSTCAVVEVADDGVGFTVPSTPQELIDADHFGLVGMTERARLGGGDLRVESGPGGTTVTLVLPLCGSRPPSPARGRAARSLAPPASLAAVQGAHRGAGRG